MKVSYGIDFGTTNSLVSSFDGQTLVSHKNANNKPHPSVVYFPNHTDPPQCGHAAYEALNSRPASISEIFSRSIKIHFADPEFSLSVYGEEYYPEELAGLILQYLGNDLADRFSGFPELSSAVLLFQLGFLLTNASA